MFDETEPGKPRDWCWTIGIIIAVCSLNLVVLVGIRILLDAEDEFDEPIVIKGEVRQVLKQLLTFFSLTFCLGCWCCFCCGGNCFRCSELCDKGEHSFASCWATLMRKKLIRHRVGFVHPERRKKEEEAKKTERQLEAGSTQQHNLFELPSITVSSPSTTPEMGDTNDAPVDSRGEMPELSRSSPSSSSSSEVHLPTVYSQRRGSLMPTGASKGVPIGRKTSREEVALRRSSAIPMPLVHPMHAGRRQSTMAVRGIDFYQIPIEKLTASSIAVIDRAYLDRQDNAMRKQNVNDGEKKEEGGKEFDEINLH